MAVFNDFELTNAGINLLGQVSTGQPLIFTKIKLGDGNFIGNVKYLTDLFSTFKEVGVSDIIIQEDGSINIKSEFSNDGFSTSKEWKEIGIFAKARETGTEVLYSYSYALLTVETIPAETIPYRRDLNFRNYISDVTNVTYDITIQKDKYDFDSDTAMQSASYLVEGDRVNVWKDDSCQKRRVAITNDNGILLNNGLYANLILDIQGKCDSSLVTISKYIVSAINECTNDKVLGSDIEGTIEDGTLHSVDEVWYSSANEKYYKCFEQNEDDYVDANKWAERSVKKNSEEINEMLETSSSILSPDDINGDVIILRKGRIRTLCFHNVILATDEISFNLSANDSPCCTSVYGALCSREGSPNGSSGEFLVTMDGKVSLFITKIAVSYMGNVTYFVD